MQLKHCFSGVSNVLVSALLLACVVREVDSFVDGSSLRQCCLSPRSDNGRIGKTFPRIGAAEHVEGITVENWGVFENAEVRLGSGRSFIAVTGESGSGKSVFIAAIQYICGLARKSLFLDTSGAISPSDGDTVQSNQVLLHLASKTLRDSVANSDSDQQSTSDKVTVTKFSRSYKLVSKTSTCFIDERKSTVKEMVSLLGPRVRFWSAQSISKLENDRFIEYIDDHIGAVHSIPNLLTRGSETIDIDGSAIVPNTAAGNDGTEIGEHSAKRKKSVKEEEKETKEKDSVKEDYPRNGSLLSEVGIAFKEWTSAYSRLAALRKLQLQVDSEQEELEEEEGYVYRNGKPLQQGVAAHLAELASFEKSLVASLSVLFDALSDFLLSENNNNGKHENNNNNKNNNKISNMRMSPNGLTAGTTAVTDSALKTSKTAPLQQLLSLLEGVVIVASSTSAPSHAAGNRHGSKSARSDDKEYLTYPHPSPPPPPLLAQALEALSLAEIVLPKIKAATEGAMDAAQLLHSQPLPSSPQMVAKMALEDLGEDLLGMQRNLDKIGISSPLINGHISDSYDRVQIALQNLEGVTSSLSKLRSLFPRNLDAYVEDLRVHRRKWEAITRRHGLKGGLASVVPSSSSSSSTFAASAVTAMLAMRARWETELEDLDNLVITLPAAVRAEAEAKLIYAEKAAELSLQRFFSAQSLASQVNAMLPELEMAEKRVRVVIRSGLPIWPLRSRRTGRVHMHEQNDRKNGNGLSIDAALRDLFAYVDQRNDPQGGGGGVVAVRQESERELISMQSGDIPASSTLPPKRILSALARAIVEECSSSSFTGSRSGMKGMLTRLRPAGIPSTGLLDSDEYDPYEEDLQYPSASNERYQGYQDQVEQLEESEESEDEWIQDERIGALTRSVFVGAADGWDAPRLEVVESQTLAQVPGVSSQTPVDRSDFEWISTIFPDVRIESDISPPSRINRGYSRESSAQLYRAKAAVPDEREKEASLLSGVVPISSVLSSGECARLALAFEAVCAGARLYHLSDDNETNMGGSCSSSGDSGFDIEQQQQQSPPPLQQQQQQQQLNLHTQQVVCRSGSEKGQDKQPLFDKNQTDSAGVVVINANNHDFSTRARETYSISAATAEQQRAEPKPPGKSTTAAAGGGGDTGGTSECLLVFDEIDAHIGGEAAVSVAKLLKRLGRTRQVLAVTHNPILAAAADKHFLVKRLTSSPPKKQQQQELQLQQQQQYIQRQQQRQQQPTTRRFQRSEIRELVSRAERLREISRMATGNINEHAGVALAEALLAADYEI